MVRHYDEDLFEGTKMTFGEHLEELRVCLIRSALGVFVGLLIGLGLARPVVKWVKTPIEAALDRYYQNRSAETHQLDEKMREVMRQRKIIAQDVWLEKPELERVAALNGWTAPAPPTQAESSAPATPAGSAPADGQPAEGTSASRAGTDAAPTIPDGPAGASAPVAIGTRSVLSEPGPPSTEMYPIRIWVQPATKTSSLSIYEPFMIWMKAAFIVGLMIASPWVFWQIWLFVAAGLYPHEKGYVFIYLPISLILFLAGILLAYYGVFPPVLQFLLDFNSKLGIDPSPRINDWISFALLLPFGFGVSFQLPMVMLFAERIGVMSIKTYVANWRVALLAIFFLSMVLTPGGDPISMVMMAIPLSALFFLGLGLCKWMPRHSSPFGPGYDPQ